jgi:V/A-type H+-transporting ATPase subunit A
MLILQRESELQEIVQLVGPDALPARDRALLDVARMIREDFLQQNAFHAVDTYCSLKKQYRMLSTIFEFHDKVMKLVDGGASVEEVSQLPEAAEISRLKYVPEGEVEAKVRSITEKVKKRGK